MTSANPGWPSLGPSIAQCFNVNCIVIAWNGTSYSGILLRFFPHLTFLSNFELPAVAWTVICSENPHQQQIIRLNFPVFPLNWSRGISFTSNLSLIFLCTFKPLFINGRKLTNKPLTFIAKKQNSHGMRIKQSAVNYNKAPFCVKVSLFITLLLFCSKRCAHTTFLCQRI